MHVLFVIIYKRRRDAKQDTCPVQCSVVVYIFLLILFRFVILTASIYCWSHFPTCGARNSYYYYYP